MLHKVERGRGVHNTLKVKVLVVFCFSQMLSHFPVSYSNNLVIPSYHGDLTCISFIIINRESKIKGFSHEQLHHTMPLKLYCTAQLSAAMKHKKLGRGQSALPTCTSQYENGRSSTFSTLFNHVFCIP